MEPVALPEDLRNVPRQSLEDYVLQRNRQFVQVFVSNLLGQDAATLPLEQAFQQTVCMLGAGQQQQQLGAEGLFLRFTHRCKFLGCKSKDCNLCNNNPHKRCSEQDNFDECYADNQVLKSKCDSDVFAELVSRTTGGRHAGSLSGVELQVCVIDGDSVGSGGAIRFDHVKELCKSDEGGVLLGAHVTGTRGDGYGRLLLKLQDGACRLPDLYITDKTDTFHMESHTYSSFRLMARAIQRDLAGNIMVLDHITPAVSEKFIVKTQRALNDYRKSEYPHYKDELTKLKFIGSITAQRLRDVQAHIANVPFTVVETVEQLKHLMLYADQNRQVEAKMLEILNMKGKHKHKWEYLREILLEKIVYDDMVHRAWFTDETMSQGLLFACKQGQVNMDKPFGIAQRVVQGGVSRLQVLSPSDAQSQELMKQWRIAAEESWNQQGHPGWTVVAEPLELVTLTGAMTAPPGPLSMGSGGRAASMGDAVDMQGLGSGGGLAAKRESTLSGPKGFATLPASYPSFGSAASAPPPAGLPAMDTGSFHFTAQRVVQTGGIVRPPSGAGVASAPPCQPSISPRLQGTGLPEVPGPLNPFAQVARGGPGGGGAGTGPALVPAGSQQQPRHDLFRASTAPPVGGSAPFAAAAAAAARPPYDPQRQGSTPHPFAVVAQQAHDFSSMDAHRTASTPAPFMQGAPSMALVAQPYRGASTPELGLPDAGAAQGQFAFEFPVSGLAGHGERPVSGPAVAHGGAGPTSRFRRMSAADVEQTAQEPQAALAGTDAQTDVGVPKRPRASMPMDPPFPLPEDSRVASADATVFEGMARTNSSVAVTLYHQESRGRHIPRSRMSMEAEQRKQQEPLQQLRSHSHHHGTVESVDPAAGISQAGLPPLPPNPGRPGPRGGTLSPSHNLSTTMQDSLHIEEEGSAGAAPSGTAQQQQSQPGAGAGAVGAAQPQPQQPHSGGFAAGASALLVECQSDSFNKTINRLLQHSGSDSFRRMLDIDFSSPSGQGQDFAAFLETLTNQEQP